MWAAAANVEAVLIPSPAGPDRKQRSIAANQQPLVVRPIDQRRDLPYIALMLESFGRPHPPAPLLPAPRHSHLLFLQGIYRRQPFLVVLAPRTLNAANTISKECGKISDLVRMATWSFGLFCLPGGAALDGLAAKRARKGGAHCSRVCRDVNEDRERGRAGSWESELDC